VRRCGKTGARTGSSKKTPIYREKKKTKEDWEKRGDWLIAILQSLEKCLDGLAGSTEDI